MRGQDDCQKITNVHARRKISCFRMGWWGSAKRKQFHIIWGSHVPAGLKREVQPDWSQRWTLPWPFLEKVLEDLLDADTHTRRCELTQSWSCSLDALAAQLSGCLWRCERQDKHENKRKLYHFVAASCLTARFVRKQNC